MEFLIKLFVSYVSPKGKKKKEEGNRRAGRGCGGRESLTLTFSGPPSSCDNFEVVIIHLCEPTNPHLAWQQGDFSTGQAITKRKWNEPPA